MSGVSRKLSKELLEEVEISIKGSCKEGEVLRKLQAIKSAKKYGISHVAEVFNVSRGSIFKWINRFAAMGAEGLKIRAGRGRKPLVNDEERAVIKS